MAVKGYRQRLPVEDLTERQAKAEHARLAAEIAEHDRRYYQEDAPTVSDADYDALRRRNDAIEARFPDLRTLDSLSQRVGAAPAAQLRQGPARRADAVARQRLHRRGRRRFRRPRPPLPRICRGRRTIAFTAEPKIDGLSMSLRYENGELVTARRAATAREGEDVTANVRTLKDIPHRLKGKACRRSARCAARST